MSWIVLDEKDGRIQLASKSHVTGMLPKGSFLTIEEGGTKFVLRVEDSRQKDPYAPSPLVVDMDLTPLEQDRKCRNIISAYRIYNSGDRDDGLIDYIKPQSEARLSNQEEIDAAMGGERVGPKVFIATVQYDQNQLLKDDNGRLITATLPNEMFYHQICICGKTGSGKTVSIKYLAQHFAEKCGGAVLAVNVKDVDLLEMDKASVTSNKSVLSEWKDLNENPHGVENFVVYYPANTSISPSKGVTPEVCERITLDVRTIEPDSLTGLMQNISDIGAMNFPNIFRFWQRREMQTSDTSGFTFSNFVEYFRRGEENNYRFETTNIRGEDSEITLHRGTYDNILRSLDVALEFFDNQDAIVIDESDILQSSKLAVIDLTGSNGIQFGAVILRDLLHKIVAAKSNRRYKVPILIVIDEVHMFYNTNASREALGDLDTICRTGRSQEIGVIFSSQNPQDMPKGLSSVINTKIFFKSDPARAKDIGSAIKSEEMENLKTGFAIASIHDLSQLKILKFPMALAGVL